MDFLWAIEGFRERCSSGFLRFLAIAGEMSGFSAVEAYSSSGSSDAEVDIHVELGGVGFSFVVFYDFSFFNIAVINFDVSDGFSLSVSENESWNRFLSLRGGLRGFGSVHLSESIQLSVARVYVLSGSHPLMESFWDRSQVPAFLKDVGAE